MPNLRRNHTKNADAGTTVAKMTFIVGLFGIGLYFMKDYLFSHFSAIYDNKNVITNTKQSTGPESNTNTNNNTKDYLKEEVDPQRPYLPSSTSKVIINHDYYSLSYDEEFEQAEWVAYKLTKADLVKPNFPRSDYFEEDPMIPTKSATFYDYKGSGYTKGHLAPAADMSFSEEAMRQSFYMSNMSPQIRGFNNGIWRELEEQTRDWAYHNKEVYLVSGPVLSSNLNFTKKGIGIPEYFYKIILDIEGPEKKAIAFLIPHEVLEERLQVYATTIDEVEKMTGINFFYGLLDHDDEINLENHIDINKWKFSEDRYELRVKYWNNQ